MTPRRLAEVRWHARAGQGAKTAAHALALALLERGKSVQAFPEYGPERRGAPLRAYTRLSDRPIRRHDGVTEPDLVVVLEPTLVREVDVAEGLREDGLVLVSGETVPPGLERVAVRCVPAARDANLVMLGAAAAALGEPPLEAVQDAAAQVLGRKLGEDRVRAAVAEGYACLA
ncbi:MAG TPA: 2-oxoacid:acceptor oxidoreductase family protein [Gaiellaceae bacterium]|nr:2-oxoacid:acceptor oxidoreductase family protein [Gaiellaceae bacterium]